MARAPFWRTRTTITPRMCSIRLSAVTPTSFCFALRSRNKGFGLAADACRRLRFLLHHLLRKLGELRQIHVLGRDLEHIVGGRRNGPRGLGLRERARAGFGGRGLEGWLRRRYRARTSSRGRRPYPILHLFHPALVAVEGPHTLLAAGLEY